MASKNLGVKITAVIERAKLAKTFSSVTLLVKRLRHGVIFLQTAYLST